MRADVASSAAPADGGAEAPVASAEAITIEVVRSLHSYAGLEGNPPVAKLIIVGATGQEEMLRSALQERFQIPCSVVDPVPALPPPAPWDERLYLAVNQDVANAISGKLFKSGREHYDQIGRAEGRKGDTVPDDWDETGAADAIDRGSAQHHPQRRRPAAASRLATALATPGSRSLAHLDPHRSLWRSVQLRCEVGRPAHVPTQLGTCSGKRNGHAPRWCQI